MNTKALLEEFMLKYPHILFDRKAIDKEVNADVSINIDDLYSVKFHATPLQDVIAFEISHGLVVPVPLDYFSSKKLL